MGRRITTLIYFAGAERELIQKMLVDLKIKNIFVSYYYIRHSRSKWLWEIQKEKGLRIMVDSGVFTMWVKYQKDKKVLSKPEAEKFIQDYVKWLDEHKEYIFGCTNFDLDVVFGAKQIDEWDNKYFIPRLKDGLDIAFVFHRKERGMNHFTDMIRKFKYVGISTFDKLSMPQMAFAARTMGSKIHAFGFTEIPQLRRAQLYSADSTTWTSGQRYGISYLFLENRLFQILKEKKLIFRKRWKNEIEAKGLDWHKIINDDSNEIQKMNAMAWFEWSNWFNAHFRQGEIY